MATVFGAPLVGFELAPGAGSFATSGNPADPVVFGVVDFGYLANSVAFVEPRPPRPSPPNPNLVYSQWNFFDQDYYNRIIVIPAVLEVQNPVIGALQSFGVWNAYLEPNTLNTITEDSTTGLTITATAPTSFTRLRYESYTATIGSGAPVNIDATWTFNFALGSATFNLVAVIAEAVVIRPNEPMSQTLEYKTNIITKYDGSEQRIAVRSNEPRQTFSLSYTFITDDEIRDEKSRLFTSLLSPIVVPMWPEFASTDADVSAGVNTITGDFSELDVRATELIFIITENDTVSQLVEVTSKTDSSIVLSNVTNFAFPAGALVYPAKTIQPVGPLGPDLYSVNAAEYDFTAIGKDDRSLGGAGGTIATYNGLPYLSERPLNESPFGDKFTKNSEILDFGGSFTIQSKQDYPNLTKDVSYFIGDRTTYQYFKKFLDTMYGRREKFYTPTFRPDIVGVAVVGGTNSIDIIPDDKLDSWLQSNANSHIRVVLNPGAVEFLVEVDAYIDNGVGPAELTVLTTVPNLDPSMEVVEINFLQLCRLASDSVSYSHYSLYSNISMKIQTVEV